jgi:hypothetical protein
LRGDIYSALVGPNGAVLDPDGVQITQGPLPEDLPDVAARAGSTLIAFSKLHGEATPEIQRIRVHDERVLHRHERLRR